jgi:hypothetical protein
MVSLIVCVRLVMSSASPVSAFPVATAGAVGLLGLIAALFATWRHNQLVYPRQLAEWSGLFLCQRCGRVTR